jgi:hypothetical protein
MIYDLDAYYELANNINADIDGYDTGAGFEPVGKPAEVSGTPFSGDFDGNFNTISGLTINRTGDYPNGHFIGLFGYATGSIHDVGLTGGSITGTVYVGGLAGALDLNGTIDNSYSQAAVTGVGGIGGLVGYLGTNAQPAIISNSYATGNVTVTGYGTAGGLVGHNWPGHIYNCYATGNVSAPSGDYVGGLVGQFGNTSVMENCYATGDVTGNDYVGGLAGSNGDPNYYGPGTITNCYATGSVTGNTSNVGGLAGYNFWGDVTNSYFTDAAHDNGIGTLETNGASAFFGNSHAVYSGSPVWDFTSTWHARVANYPFLQWQSQEITWTGAGDGNWSDPANWSTNTVPTDMDDVLFSASYIVASTIDEGFNSSDSIYSLTINSGYTETITDNANLTISGNYTQADGTFSGGTVLTIGGNVTLTGGTLTAPTNMYVAGDWTIEAGGFACGTSTVTFTGTGSHTITTDGAPFYNVVFNADQIDSVAHWLMNDNTEGSYTVEDSIDGHDGTSAVHDTYSMHVEGKIDGALTFNGTTDTIDTNTNF